jgi:hypothetical protein
MAEKPEFVDLIGAATRQRYRSRAPGGAGKAGPGAEAEAKQERRLSNWPPAHLEQWRLETLTSWRLKLKSWKYKDWA